MNDTLEFCVKGYTDITVTMSSIELFEKLVRSLHCNALLEDDFSTKYWYAIHEGEIVLKYAGSNENYDDRGSLYMMLQDLGSQIIPNWENRSPNRWAT